MDNSSFRLTDEARASQIMGSANVAHLKSILGFLSRIQAGGDLKDLEAFAKRLFASKRREIVASKLQRSVLPVLTIVEGNIGIGKTTYIKKLQDANPALQIVPEPLSIWQSIGFNGKSSFEQFYEEIEFAERRSPYVLAFEIITLITRFGCLVNSFQEAIRPEGSAPEHLVTERCFLTDR